MRLHRQAYTQRLTADAERYCSEHPAGAGGPASAAAPPECFIRRFLRYLESPGLRHLASYNRDARVGWHEHMAFQVPLGSHAASTGRNSTAAALALGAAALSMSSTLWCLSCAPRKKLLVKTCSHKSNWRNLPLGAGQGLLAMQAAAFPLSLPHTNALPLQWQ